MIDIKSLIASFDCYAQENEELQLKIKDLQNQKILLASVNRRIEAIKRSSHHLVSRL
jgi:hypothetical protein